jgi:DNA-binding LacI/PurR family transcriptional regulator
MQVKVRRPQERRRPPVATPRPRRHGDDRVTVDDVARLAGVSTATVSRVVNHSSRVSPEAREAVTRAIDQLGYVPNRAARSLMTRRTESVGVVILESAARLFGDPFFGQLMLGVSAGLSDRERQLVLMTAPTASEEGRVERYLAAGHVDGAILVGPHGNDPLPRRLVRGRLPVVVNGRPLDGSVVSFVDAQNRTGARAAVDHLVAIGRRSIATIYGTLDLASGLDRLDGYHDALKAAGRSPDPALEAAGGFSPPMAEEAMRALLGRRPDLDAVFVASDSMAAAALRVLRELGCRVPEDIAVIGFDDSPVALECRPTLSTIRQPIQAMGREMVRLLLHQIDQPGEAAQQVIFGTELIVRDSSDPLAEPGRATDAADADRVGV